MRISSCMLVDINAGERHEQAIDPAAPRNSADCVLTLQSLGEFFHVVTRKGKVAPADAAAVIESLRAAFPVGGGRSGDSRDRLPAVLQHGLSYWDAMLWATVQQAGCRLLLSEDFQDGRRLGQVTFIDPFESRNSAALDQAFG